MAIQQIYTYGTKILSYGGNIYAYTKSLLTGIYGVWNGDYTGVATLDTSVYSVYNADLNANDSYGTNNGTFTGTATYSTGVINNAFSFNGSSYVALPTNTHEFTGDFTVSFWINLTSVTGNCCPVANYMTSGVRNGWLITIQNDKSISFNGFYSDIQYASYSSSSSAISTGVWTHIVLVHQAGVGVTMYKNGSVLGTGFSNGSLGYYSTTYPTIGASHYNGALVNDYVTGAMDAVTFWSRTLTATEVIQLYNVGSGVQYPYSNKLLPSLRDQFGSNDGTAMGGLTYDTGKIGSSFIFNGTNSFIKLPTNSLNFTGDFSISAWIYIPTGYIGTSEIIILCNEYVATYFNNPYGWYLLLVGNSVYFETHVGTNTTTNLIASHTFTTAAWHHIVLTRKAGTRSSIYINGSLANSDTNTIDPVYSTTHVPTIGAEYLVGSIHDNSIANAKIDALTTWTRELSSSDVTDLYNSGTGKQYPSL